MRILITGATGLVGRVLSEKLVKKGHTDIVILTRNKGSAKALGDFPFKVHEWENPSEQLPPLEALDGVDAVIHLMGESVAEGRWSAAKKKALVSSRVDATKNLLAGFEKIGQLPSSFISASAVGFYGDRQDELLGDNSAKGEGYLSDLCRDWEDASKVVGEMRVVHIRIGIVLSGKGGALAKMLLPFKLGMGGRLGNGNQYMSWIHVDDLAELFIFALENVEIRGPLNGTAPEPVTNSEFTKTLGRVLSRPTIAPVPAIALRTLFGEMSQILLTGQRAVPQKSLSFGFRFKYQNLSSALNDILKKSPDGEVVFREISFVPKPVDEVFDFFSEAKNLEKITPEFLNFKILSQSTPVIQQGTRFDYRLKLHGLPIKWRSEITEWEKNRYFQDIQLRGPYKKWHHTHRFKSVEGGTLVEDEVRYCLPFGNIGRYIAGGFVNSDLEKIFNFRKKTVNKLLTAGLNGREV